MNCTYFLETRLFLSNRMKSMINIGAAMKNRISAICALNISKFPLDVVATWIAFHRTVKNITL